ncbi:unnamed protein product, partial [Cylicostephanus goldi]
ITEFAEKAAQAHAEIQAQASTKSGAQTSSEEVQSSEAAPSSTAPSAAPAKEADPWDLLDPVDVIAKLPADFSTNIESKKWTERRDALQAFLDLLTANPRLDPKASYGEHISLLKRIIEKDANINVAALAAKCMKCVADGLRKKFAPHAPAVVPVIFDKFKEKKPLLRDPLVECIDAIAATLGYKPKAFSRRCALPCSFAAGFVFAPFMDIYRIFKVHNSQTMPKKTLKAIAPLLIKKLVIRSMT